MHGISVNNFSQSKKILGTGLAGKGPANLKLMYIKA